MSFHARPLLACLAAAGGLFVALSAVETGTDFAGDRAAHADTAEAKRAAPVMSSPGERSRVVTRVRAGDKLTVLGSDGRWTKVRVNGRTGWITRSNLVAPQARKAVSTKRRRPFVEGRSKKRKRRKSGPSDRVGADAVEEDFIEEDGLSDDDSEGDEGDEGEQDEKEEAPPPKKVRKAKTPAKKVAKRASQADDEDLDDEEEEEEEEAEDEQAEEDDEDEDEPDRETVRLRVAEIDLMGKPNSKSKVVGFAAEGDALFVIRRSPSGQWLKVENEDGEIGWVRTSKVDEGSSYQRAALDKKVFGGLGYLLLKQAFRSNSTNQFGTYNMNSAAGLLSVGGELTYDYSPEYLIGGDLSYSYGRASPGIRFQHPETGEAADIGFQLHRVDVGLRGGYKLGRSSGMAAFGRLGYHYDRFAVNDVEDFNRNLAKLPSEVLSGPTIGAMLDLPHITDKIAARVSIHYLGILAKRVQTAGLEDGDVSRTSALWGALRVDYFWKGKLRWIGAYQYQRSKTEWRGRAEQSQRDHQADEADRTDQAHLVTLGLRRDF